MQEYLIWVPLIVLQIIWFIIAIRWVDKNINSKKDIDNV